MLFWLLIFSTLSQLLTYLLLFAFDNKLRLTFKIIFKTTCLLSVKEERTGFFSLFFAFIVSCLPARFQPELSVTLFFVLAYENQVCIRQIKRKNMIDI